MAKAADVIVNFAIGALFSVYIPQPQQTEEGRRAQSRKGELSFSVLATLY